MGLVPVVQLAGCKGGPPGRQSPKALHEQRLRSGQLGQPPTTQEPMPVGEWGAADHLHGQDALYLAAGYAGCYRVAVLL